MDQMQMHNQSSVDSLGGALLGDADIVSGIGDSVALREVSPIEMFGARSHPFDVVATVAQPPQTLVSDGVFQILVVVMLLSVSFFISRHRHHIITMFGRMLKGRLPEDYSSGRRDELFTRTFLHYSALIGVMLITLGLVKYAPVWFTVSLSPAAERWTSLVVAGIVLTGCLAVAGFEHLLLWIIGKVTNSDDNIGAILYLKRSYFALAGIVLSPVFLLGMLSAEKVTDIWNIILIIESAVLTLMFLKETLAFFIDKKIPIFHWFLYLCAVEVFPLSLIWALTIRS